MVESGVAEAIRLISSMSQNDIMAALQSAFRSPAPPVSARAAANFVSQWNSLEARLQRLLMRDPLFIIDPGEQRPRIIEDLYTDPQTGLKLQREVPQKPVLRLDPRCAKQLQKIFEAAAKCGVPRETDSKSASSAVTGAATRYAARTATLNGTWQSALLTSVFDIKLLFDGESVHYLTKIGVSGLYGGAVAGLSSRANHPFFGNSVVLSVLVASAFGAVSLVSTGDWARFGKNVGVGIIGGAASWSGAVAGGAISSSGGPVGTTLGVFAGGTLAGLAARRVALMVPGLGGLTECEVQAIYGGIRRQLAAIGVEPDPSLSSREVVAAFLERGSKQAGLPFQVRLTGSMVDGVKELHDALSDMRDSSPEAFGELLSVLRSAGQTRSQ